MKFQTKFRIGDVADFFHCGRGARIRVDEIRIRTMEHIPNAQGKVLIEYRQHYGKEGRAGISHTRWWPEAWASQ